jgi:hypothetical protein
MQQLKELEQLAQIRNFFPLLLLFFVPHKICYGPLLSRQYNHPNSFWTFHFKHFTKYVHILKQFCSLFDNVNLNKWIVWKVKDHRYQPVSTKITSDLTTLTTAILILTVQMFFECTYFGSFLCLHVASINSTRLLVKLFSRLSRRLSVFDPVCIQSFMLICDRGITPKDCWWNFDTPCIRGATWSN